MPLRAAPPPEFHLCSGVWNAACLCVLARVWGGRRTGGRHCPQLHSELGEAVSATAPKPGTATAFQINGLFLSVSPSFPPARLLPLRPLSVRPLTSCVSRVHLPSTALLARSPSFSHSLSLLVTLCLFFSSPFVSRTCPCSPSQAHFLSSLPSSSQLLVSRLSPVRSWQPPPRNLPAPINPA